MIQWVQCIQQTLANLFKESNSIFEFLPSPIHLLTRVWLLRRNPQANANCTTIVGATPLLLAAEKGQSHLQTLGEV